MKDLSCQIDLVFHQGTGGMVLIVPMAMKNSGLNNRTHVEQSRRKHINGVLQTCNIPLHAVSEV
jgi:hypothetical protein